MGLSVRLVARVRLEREELKLQAFKQFLYLRMEDERRERRRLELLIAGEQGGGIDAIFVEAFRLNPIPMAKEDCE